MSKRMVDVLAALAVIWGLLAVSPLWMWGFKPGDTLVEDAELGQPAGIAFTRTIWRSIKMHYTVSIRRVDSWQVVCDTSSGPFTYSPSASLPERVDMAWWAPGDERCSNLFPPGSYVMETCWTASGLLWGIVPPKTACRTSNVFHVRKPA